MSRSAGDAYTRFVATRFLRARRQGSLSLIALLSALSFVLGVASLIIVLALMTGFQQDVVGKILGANAHMIVQRAYAGERIEDPALLGERIIGVAGVEAVSSRVWGFGLLRGPSGHVDAAQNFGIDPKSAGAVTDLPSQMEAGSFAALGQPTSSGRPGIIIGHEMAKRQALLPGDMVRLLLPVGRLTPWGAAPLQKTFEVVGIFNTGFYEYDTTWTFIALEVAQTLHRIDGSVHWLAVRIDDIDRLESVKASLQAVLGPDYAIRDIVEQNRSFFSALKLEKLMMFIAIGLIVLVAAMGIVSTLVLTVAQRRREIGVLAALGARPGGVLKIFILQGTAMGTLGTFVGAVLGVGICIWFDSAEVIKLDPDVYYLSHLPFEVKWSDLAAIVTAALATSFAATIYPAWRAARLDPVEALRHE